MMTPQLVSIPEAAARLGVSRIRVWQWVRDERLPAVRLGNYWFINPDDLGSIVPQKRGRRPKEPVCA